MAVKECFATCSALDLTAHAWQQAQLGLRYGGLRYEGLRYGGLRYEGLRYGGLRYEGLRYGGLRYGGLRYGGLRYGGLRYGGLRYGGLMYGGLRYGGLRYGGLGLCSLALHACAAYIASISSSGFADVDNQHLKHAVNTFNGL